jgi:hypothetical protein
MAKYEDIVRDVFRNRDSGWALKYYADSKTSWDLQVGRVQFAIHQLAVEIQTNRALLAKLDKAFAAAGLPPDHADYVKLSRAEHTTMDRDYVVAEHVLATLMGLREEQEDLLLDYRMNQHLEAVVSSSMRRLQEKFREDGDADFLRRGITWAFEYAAKHRIASSASASASATAGEDEERLDLSAW